MSERQWLLIDGLYKALHIYIKQRILFFYLFQLLDVFITFMVGLGTN